MDQPTTEVRIRMLGEFAVEIAGVNVGAPITRSKKLRGVLQYLLLNRTRPVPYTELYDSFWQDEHSTNPQSALKTLIYRLRAAMVQGGAPEELELVISKRGSYQWNPELSTVLDTDEFEQYGYEAQREDITARERTEALQKMTALYKGPLINDSELWMMGLVTYYQECYTSAVSELCILLENEARYEEASSLCRAALRFAELDESLNIHLIRNLAAQGKHRDAIAWYQHVVDIYYDQMGVQVSGEMRELYTQIVEKERSTEMNIDQVRSELSSEWEGDTGGAFVCEYGVFRSLYRVEERSLSRYGGRTYLGLITLQCKPDPDAREALPREMKNLLEVASSSLRNCDVMARFSPTQYVLLLPTVTYESGQMVLDRICRAYRRKFPRSKMEVVGKVRPLQPAAGTDKSRS